MFFTEICNIIRYTYTFPYCSRGSDPAIQKNTSQPVSPSMQSTDYTTRVSVLLITRYAMRLKVVKT
jgi:hypothetical protein